MSNTTRGRQPRPKREKYESPDPKRKRVRATDRKEEGRKTRGPQTEKAKFVNGKPGEDHRTRFPNLSQHLCPFHKEKNHGTFHKHRI